MRKRFLLEGEQNDQPIYIAVEFKNEKVSVFLYLYPKAEMDIKTLQNWVKNGSDLPPAFQSLERTIQDANLLPQDIKVEQVGKVRDIEIAWSDNLMQTRMIQGFEGELLLIKDRVAALEDFDQNLFDECSDFWNRILQFKQENNSLDNKVIDKFKLELDILFEALKALRKDFKKEQSAKAIEIKADLLLKLELIEKKLNDKPNYKSLIERLKEVRAGLNKSGLRQNHYAEIDEKINALFNKMGADKEEKNKSKYKKRINDLEGIVNKMQKSIDWDKRELIKEEKNKQYAEQVFQIKLIDAKIDLIKTRVKEKESKLVNITETLDSLKKKINNN